MRPDSRSSDLPEKTPSQGNVCQGNGRRRCTEDSPDNHSPDFSPALSMSISRFHRDGSVFFGCGFAALPNEGFAGDVCVNNNAIGVHSAALVNRCRFAAHHRWFHSRWPRRPAALPMTNDKFSMTNSQWSRPPLSQAHFGRNTCGLPGTIGTLPSFIIYHFSTVPAGSMSPQNQRMIHAPGLLIFQRRQLGQGGRVGFLQNRPRQFPAARPPRPIQFRRVRDAPQQTPPFDDDPVNVPRPQQFRHPAVLAQRFAVDAGHHRPRARAVFGRKTILQIAGDGLRAVGLLANLRQPPAQRLSSPAKRWFASRLARSYTNSSTG